MASNKLNWAVRFKNKAFLVTFIPFVISFIYQLLSMLGIVPSLNENEVTAVILNIVNVLAIAGIVLDGTTEGFTDKDGRIDWSRRLRNKAFLITFVPALVGVVYQILSLFNIVPKIDQTTLLDGLNQILNILILVGIVNDGTTKGLADSALALSYTAPAPKTVQRE